MNSELSSHVSESD